MLKDKVQQNSPGSKEIGFILPDRYNASAILFDNLKSGRGNRIALYSSGKKLTYSELCMHSCRIGNALLSQGLNRGDRVMMFLNDTPDYAAAVFGTLRAGLVPMMINTLSSKELVQFYLEDSGAKAALINEEYGNLFKTESLSGTRLKKLIVVDGDPPPGLGTVGISGPDWFKDFPGLMVEADTHRNDMAFWMYSSGSTGRPKGIIHLQHDLAYTAASYGRNLLGLCEEDICFSVSKIFFAYGFGNSLTFPFSVGAASALLEQWPTPSAIFDAVYEYRPTLFFALPTVYTALINYEGTRDTDFSSVRRFISAAEVLSGDVFKAWKERFGKEIIEGLGSTEVLHIYLSNTLTEKKPGSAGKRVPGYELKLTDHEGKPAGVGCEGVLWVRGDSNAPCYWNRPEKTAETMREGWIWTGDRFVMDEDGFYFFVGRADDLIKVSGQWVYPMEVELCLNEHPKVKQCAVLGEKLPDGRMTLSAYIEVNKGVALDEFITGQLQNYVKKTLLPYKYPRKVVYLEELPKTGTGKIDRQALSRVSS